MQATTQSVVFVADIAQGVRNACEQLPDVGSYQVVARGRYGMSLAKGWHIMWSKSCKGWQGTVLASDGVLCRDGWYAVGITGVDLAVVLEIMIPWYAINVEVVNSPRDYTVA